MEMENENENEQEGFGKATGSILKVDGRKVPVDPHRHSL